MLQLQYFNSNLTKKQIDGILNNFNIKYTTVKNEIDSKVNNLLKLFMDDILSFLENIEEITKEHKKLKEFEHIQREYDVLSLKLKEKTQNEHKLESDIISLQKEIEYLKKENKNQQNKITELNTPMTTKNKPIRSLFGNKKHLKIKSDNLNYGFNNSNRFYTKTDPNIYNTSINTPKNIKKSKVKTFAPNKEKNTAKVSSTIIKKYLNKSRDKNGKHKKSLSPDIAKPKKRNITDNLNNLDKTLQKIKKYTMNRNNEQIKKMQFFRLSKNKNKFKNKLRNDFLKHDSNYKIEEFNKKTTTIQNGKNNENIDKEDNDLEKNQTFEYAHKFLSLVESIPVKDTINGNNYSEDEENNSKNMSLINKSISDEDDDNNNEENIDNEIKELEEDENNILQIMKQIKELGHLT